MALIVSFIGLPGTNPNSFQWTSGSNTANVPMVAPEVAVPAVAWVAIAVLVAAAVFLGLLFLLIASVMEFVFIESLRQHSVTIRRYWGRRWGQGLRLFGFRIALFAVVVVAVLALAAPLISLWWGGAQSLGEGVVWVAILVVPVIVAVAAIAGIVHGFTTVFVVPIMVLEDTGVVAGWRRLWPVIRSNPVEFGAYLIASLVLTVVGALVFGTVLGFLAVLLLLPFGVVAALGAGLLVVAEPLGWLVIGFVALVYLFTVLVLAALIQVPIQTYLRYYALLVLGDIDEELDLIPEQRETIRDADAETT